MRQATGFVPAYYSLANHAHSTKNMDLASSDDLPSSAAPVDPKHADYDGARKSGRQKRGFTESVAALAFVRDAKNKTRIFKESRGCCSGYKPSSFFGPAAFRRTASAS